MVGFCYYVQATFRRFPIHIKDMANVKPKQAKFTKSSHRESPTSIERISRI